MSTTYTNAGPIFITQSKYDALVTAGTVEVGREYVIVDADTPLVNADLHTGATTLDATLVVGKQYILTSQSATFNMVLPTTGTYNDQIEVIFPATAAFTPTSSVQLLGDTIPQTTAGKTYNFLFSWMGSGWLFNWLAW